MSKKHNKKSTTAGSPIWRITATHYNESRGEGFPSKPLPPVNAVPYVPPTRVLRKRLRNSVSFRDGLPSRALRLRSRDAGVTVSDSVDVYFVGEDEPRGTYPGNVSPRLAEVFEDVPQGRHNSTNPCKHSLLNEILYADSTFGDLWQYDSVGDFYLRGVTPQYYGQLLSVDPDMGNPRIMPDHSRFPAGYQEYVDDLQSLHDRAWDRMKPTLNSCPSNILNFLYELPELKFLYKDWVKDLNNWKRLFSIFHQDLGKTAKVLSGANLSYQFGLRPFVNDVINLYSTLVNVNKNITEFVSRAGVFQKHHTRFVQSFSDSSTWVPYGSISSICASNEVRCSRRVDCTYHASAIYKYSCPDVQSTWNTLSKYLTYMGVSLDGEILWEEVPFSFVVDWFYNVSKFLHDRRYDLFKVDVTLADFCYSLKSTMRCSAGLLDNGFEKSIGNSRSLYYIRDRAVPANVSNANYGHFTFNRLGLALSLGGVRVHD